MKSNQEIKEEEGEELFMKIITKRLTRQLAKQGFE